MAFLLIVQLISSGIILPSTALATSESPVVNDSSVTSADEEIATTEDEQQVDELATTEDAKETTEKANQQTTNEVTTNKDSKKKATTKATSEEKVAAPKSIIKTVSVKVGSKVLTTNDVNNVKLEDSISIDYNLLIPLNTFKQGDQYSIDLPKNKDYSAVVTFKNQTKTVVISSCIVTVGFTGNLDVGGETEVPPTTPTKPTPPAPGTNGGNGSNNGNNSEGGTITVPKKDTTYDVYDENGNIVAKNVKAGKDGKVDLSKLPAGKYKLVSKDGKNTMTFSVNKDGQVVLPQTGENIFATTLIGLALLAMGAFVIARNRKKTA